MSTSLAQAKTFWTGLPAARRRLLLAAGTATLVAVLLVAAVGSRPPQYAPLYTHLAPSDAAAIVAKLSASKVPYQLSSDGKTISVPQDQVAKLRLQMAAQGLPNSGTVGLGIVDSLGFSATNFQQQIAYLRALQGELTQTISQIDGVAGARVHIVLPKNQIFSTTAPKATAAVLVRLTPGATLGPGQVGAIQHLVASSVQGLKPADVTVVDQQGVLLSSSAGQAGAVSASGDLTTQQRFQQQLQGSLDRLLSQVFGLGNVVTHVQAQLNFDHRTITQNLFTAPSAQGKGSGKGQPQGLLENLQQLKEQFKGQGVSPAIGVPGTSSNSIPNYPVVGAKGGNSSYVKDQTNQKYALDETQTRTQVAPGAVKRLSVAVVINRKLSPVQQQAIVRTVSAAIGADPARHDQIDVVGMPFTASLASQLGGAPAPAKAQAVSPVVYAAAGGALLVLAAVLWALLGAGKKRRRDDAEADLAAELVGRAKGENGPALPEIEGLLSLPLKDRVQRRPEDVASILRLWMSEE